MSAELSSMDLAACIRRLPKKVERVLKEEGRRVFLAGGYIRSVIAHEDVNDIDLFVGNAADAMRMALLIGDNPIKSKNAYTIMCGITAVQIIHRWTFNTPTECIKEFDFTIAQAAMWFDTVGWKSCISPAFYQDLAARRLVYTNPAQSEVGGSVLRLLKFTERGYRMPMDSIGLLLANLLSNVKATGMVGDTDGVAKVITAQLVEVDPNAIVIGYEPPVREPSTDDIDWDEVFNT